MKKFYCIVVILLFFASGHEVFSQKKSSKSKGKSELGSSATKNVGIGIRIGDPLGLTVKKYFNDKVAIEFNLGKTFFWGSGYDPYYRYYYDKHHPVYQPYYVNGRPYYNGRQVPPGAYYRDGFYYYDPWGVSMQLHLLGHKSIASATGLQIYYGAGPQLRIINYKYAYWYNAPGGPYYYEDRYRQVAFGLDGIFGAEYTFKDVPVSVFADINLYAEIVPIPLYLGIQGGIGARFNF